MLYIAQNIVRVPNILTVRLSSGTKSIPAAPYGAAYSLTPHRSIAKPSKVYAHRYRADHGLNVREDIGWNDHSQLKLIQFHQFPASYAQEVELDHDHEVLRQGGSDGGFRRLMISVRVQLLSPLTLTPSAPPTYLSQMMAPTATRTMKNSGQDGLKRSRRTNTSLLRYSTRWSNNDDSSQRNELHSLLAVLKKGLLRRIRSGRRLRLCAFL